MGVASCGDVVKLPSLFQIVLAVKAWVWTDQDLVLGSQAGEPAQQGFTPPRVLMPVSELMGSRYCQKEQAIGFLTPR